MVITCLRCPKCKQKAELHRSNITGDYRCKNCFKIAYTSDQETKLRDRILQVRRNSKHKK